MKNAPVAKTFIMVPAKGAERQLPAKPGKIVKGKSPKKGVVTTKSIKKPSISNKPVNIKPGGRPASGGPKTTNVRRPQGR